MLTETEKMILRKKLVRYEGNVPHMYLDSLGHVTIGVGHLVRNLRNALKLNLVVAGGERAGAIATKEQLTADYENVKKQPPGQLAYKYKKYTKLIMKVVEVNRLTNKHIKSFYSELKRLFPEFDDYPTEARLALLDIIFNLGMTKLRKEWPKLNKAVKIKDWTEAAAESNRPELGDLRNSYVRELFEATAKSADENTRPVIDTKD